MHAAEIMTVILLMFSTAGSCFTADEADRFERRSDVRANLHAAFDVIYNGEKEILDFRLTDLQVALLDGCQLAKLRNAVYARYGLIFVSDDVREHFQSFEWYRPLHEDVSDELTETDLWNIRLIRHYEDRLEDDGSGPPEGTDLTGFWHGSPSVGSGYSDLFLLFDDGNFAYRENSMDGSRRLRELSGRWRVEGSHLVLEADSAVFLEGGEIVEPYASWGSEYVIEGADIAGRKLIGMEALRLPMDGYTSNYAESSGSADFEHLTVPYMRIGIDGYWRIDRDPDMERLN